MVGSRSNKCNVVCKWREKDQFLVNPDGQVWPCCYLANAEYFKELTGNDPSIDYPRGNDRSYIIEQYMQHKDGLNAFKHSIDKVFLHRWWKELEKSWDDPDKVDRRCVRYCQADDKTPR